MDGRYLVEAVPVADRLAQAQNAEPQVVLAGGLVFREVFHGGQGAQDAVYVAFVQIKLFADLGNPERLLFGKAV
ncbi:hypothetical protein SDC9_190363 [bioreactor metagenome]|uniref:Uncharacterized protein n=1 Tax=bioreactor metagenome TaxID=1076179 RepID=A0A645HUS5_9ZZZZ